MSAEQESLTPHPKYFRTIRRQLFRIPEQWLVVENTFLRGDVIEDLTTELNNPLKKGLAAYKAAEIAHRNPDIQDPAILANLLKKQLIAQNYPQELLRLIAQNPLAFAANYDLNTGSHILDRAFELVQGIRDNATDEVIGSLLLDFDAIGQFPSEQMVEKNAIELGQALDDRLKQDPKGTMMHFELSKRIMSGVTPFAMEPYQNRVLFLQGISQDLSLIHSLLPFTTEQLTPSGSHEQLG